MKKRLLFAALALVCTANTFAFEVDEYVFTKTQRLKVTGNNIVTNSDFSNGTEGWTDATGSGVDADTWLVEAENAPGPNGENAIVSQAANEGDATALCRQFYFDADAEGAFAPGFYLVSYQIKGSPTAINTTVGETIGSNYAGVFTNTDGSFAQVASTEEAPVVGVAAVTAVADEWVTVNYYVEVPDKTYLVIRFEKMASDIMMTNFAVQPVEEVYDIRIIQSKIDWAQKLMEDENFNVEDAGAEKETLQKTINQANKMIENDQLDSESTGENLAGKLEKDLVAFLDVSSCNIAKNDYFNYVEDIRTVPSSNRGGVKDGQQVGGFVLRGNNWFHQRGKDENGQRTLLDNPYWTKYIGYGNVNGPGSISLYNAKMPAGKYYIAAEMRNCTEVKAGKVWDLESLVKAFVGTDSVECGTICGEDFVKFYYVGELKEGEKLDAGFYWYGPDAGSTFQIGEFEIRSFDKGVDDYILRLNAWETYEKQWSAAVSARNDVMATYRNGNYPWERQQLEEAMRTWDPYFKAQQAKGWITADGKDAGIATIDELNDWALYQGVELYSEPDGEGNTTRLEYQLVRGYQNANNAVKNANKPITDLAAAIEEAKSTRNKGTNATGDRATYKTAIETALATLKQVRDNTSDATREADAATLEAALNTLNEATAAFLASVTDVPVVDIDFSNNFEEYQESEEASPVYRILGTSGEIRFDLANVNTSNGVEGTEDTNFRRGYLGDLTDVLRIGKGTATVPLNVAETDNKVMAEFDLYVGNLVNRNVYVEFRNAANERVAGFSLNRYDGILAYNDFNDVLTNGGTGLNILGFVSGVGKGGVENASIHAESNKSHFELIVNYADQTLQGSVINGTNGKCEGATVPFRSDITDHVITNFVVGSAYDNNNRQCWFDNLKIFRYGEGAADFEEEITESAWASETAFDPWTEGIVDVKSDKSSQIIYTLSGVRVNKAQKGIYIVNGKKVVIK